MTAADDTQPTLETSTNRERSRLVLQGILPGDSLCHILEGNRLVLGRGESCDLRLDWSRVSRRHAELRRQGPTYALADLGSTNGTFVDGRRVRHSAVRPGMILRVGDWLGMIEQLDETALSAEFAEHAPGIWGGALLARTLVPLRAAAPSDLPVVVCGATGVGKEGFASAVHHFSGRRAPFYPINCAALPQALAEAELFGYRRGAFTSAEHHHEGHLRAAAAGTLFLDEVADLQLEVQAKLLRVLERKVFTGLGGTGPVKLMARVVAALQQRPAMLVEAGKLREDFAARLSGLVVHIPALRERRSDVPRLFHRFLWEHSGGRPPAVSTRLYESLCLYEWPHNVRELELLARRLLSVHRLEPVPVLRRSHLPEGFRPVSSNGSDRLTVVSPDRREHDRIELLSALQRTDGNLTRAAKLAGISRQRAYRLINEASSTADSDAALGVADHKS